MKRSALDQLALEHRLAEPAIALALDLTGARPDAAAWRRFSIRLLTGAGIAALGAGAIFFVAANWQDYGLMGRFAILQVAFAAAVGIALWKPPPAHIGQANLVLATLLAGALLALFGQSYQTGADVFELFFAWAALTLPFAIAGRSGAVWATWWMVLNVGMALYCSLQDASLMRWLWSSRLGIERPLLIFFACLINLGGAVLFEHLGLPRWLQRMAATLGFFFGTAACMVAIFSNAGLGVIAAFALTSGIVAWVTLRRRSDVFPMALVFAAWIAISTAFLIRHMKFDDLGAFFVLTLWLIGSAGAAGFVLMKWVREWTKPGSES